MGRCFNTTGSCDPQLHYMVDIQERLSEIKKLIDDGKYFAINRARQYGKTTTLKALEGFLNGSYGIVSLDFQFLSQANFETEKAFVRAFSRELITAGPGSALPGKIEGQLRQCMADSGRFPGKSAAWTKNGFLEAVKLLLSEKNALFESLIGKILDSRELRKVSYSILFSGEQIVYNPDDPWLGLAMMYGFIRNLDGTVAISNQIFEMRLYNFFLSTTKAQCTEIFQAAAQDKNQFIHSGHLDMELVLKKFVEHFYSIYGDSPEEFDEEEGRRRFLLYLRPIINGAGNYYIEARTRNARRMDVVVDYSGEQFIIELKVWRGSAYHERGEQQLSDYLDYFRLKKGYMLSYNFNRKKEPGVKTLTVGDRLLVEAVV